MNTTTKRFSMPRVIGAVALVALLVAMVLNTKFVTPDELASMGPDTFEPKTAAQDLYDEALKGSRDAPAFADVQAGLQDDVAGAAKRFDAARPSDTTFVFTVAGQGTVVASKNTGIELKVDGVPSQTPVSLAAGSAVNGTAVRDGMGFQFGDAPNQSAYQQVGNQLKALMNQRLQQGAGDLKPGTALEFLGVVSVTDTGTPQSPNKPVVIQPISVEAR